MLLQKTSDIQLWNVKVIQFYLKNFIHHKSWKRSIIHDIPWYLRYHDIFGTSARTFRIDGGLSIMTFIEFIGQKEYLNMILWTQALCNFSIFHTLSFLFYINTFTMLLIHNEFYHIFYSEFCTVVQLYSIVIVDKNWLFIHISNYFLFGSFLYKAYLNPIIFCHCRAS